MTIEAFRRGVLGLICVPVWSALVICAAMVNAHHGHYFQSTDILLVFFGLPVTLYLTGRGALTRGIPRWMRAWTIAFALLPLLLTGAIIVSLVEDLIWKFS